MIEQKRKGFSSVVEVGAYDGVDAKEMSDNGFEVFSFEASKVNFDRCVSNYPPESYSTINFINAAASASNGVVEFIDDGGTGACVDCNTGVTATSVKRKVRTVALESALELQSRFGEVGFIKIDVQGHEPQVFSGMMKWLRDDSIAPPIIEFEFDPCLMRSAGTGRSEVVAMLQSLLDAGYTLSDGKVSEYESRVYAFNELAKNGGLPNWVVKNKLEVDAALNDPKVAQLIDQKALEMAWERPLGCGDLIDWYCPKDRSTETWRTYTDVIATKRKKFQHAPSLPK